MPRTLIIYSCPSPPSLKADFTYEFTRRARPSGGCAHPRYLVSDLPGGGGLHFVIPEIPDRRKPLTCHHWKRAEVVAAIGKVKAVTVTNPDELMTLYCKLAPLAPEMMTREMIPADDNGVLSFLGYVSHDGTPPAGCVHKKLRQYPPGFGYCSLTETVEPPKIMDLAIRLLKALNYRGIGCVEFKRAPRDGQTKLVENNARAVRKAGIATAAGVDLAWNAYHALTSTSRPVPVFNYTVTMRGTHLQDETQAAADLIKAGKLGLWEWLRIFHGRIVMAEWARDDLRPGVLALSLLLRRLFNLTIPADTAQLVGADSV